MEELNKCPFCGGDAEVIGRKKIRVICKACKASSPIFTLKSLAISYWNERTDNKENRK